MKKIKQYKKWGIYLNNEKEVLFYGFKYTVIHPGLMGCSLLSPGDSDMELNSLEDCISLIDNY